ncbi:hypothetical protein BY996DRAFT_8438751 [Phakopsora pachyrhizi]|nr:hypothetical protein BY996DRAFT_8438751 [Phakopsora pachyrhizi]
MVNQMVYPGKMACITLHVYLWRPMEWIRYLAMSDELAQNEDKANELNSLRKLMSMIVRCLDGKIRLLCKDLRTLLVSSRLVKKEELEEFQRSYRDASNNGGLERKDLIKKAADKFEQGLEILGAMTLKDKLQTAIAIGCSYKMLKNTMEIIISSDTEEGTQSQIKQG